MSIERLGISLRYEDVADAARLADDLAMLHEVGPDFVEVCPQRLGIIVGGLALLAAAIVLQNAAHFLVAVEEYGSEVRYPAEKLRRFSHYSHFLRRVYGLVTKSLMFAGIPSPWI